MKRSKYGITVATWVCCSITSDTQTRYGVGSVCQGKPLRPCRSNQVSSRSAKPAISATPRMTHPVENLSRIIAQAGADPADTSREGARPRPPHWLGMSHAQLAGPHQVARTPDGGGGACHGDHAVAGRHQPPL